MMPVNTGSCRSGRCGRSSHDFKGGMMLNRACKSINCHLSYSESHHYNWYLLAVRVAPEYTSNYWKLPWRPQRPLRPLRPIVECITLIE